MARFCGGIALGDSLKIINGVICDKDATTVDVESAVSTCGQLWDGALFTKLTVDGVPVISVYHSGAEDPGTPIKMRGSCGVGFDKRHFAIADGKVILQDGFILTVNVTPDDATIAVADAEGTAVGPVSGTTNVFLLPDIGDQYTVTVSKTGYTTQTVTVSNNDDQTVNIELVTA